MLKINLRPSLERYETGTYCNSHVKFLETFNRSLPFIPLPSMLISFVTNAYYYYYYYSLRAYFRSLTFIEFFPSFDRANSTNMFSNQSKIHGSKTES